MVAHTDPNRWSCLEQFLQRQGYVKILLHKCITGHFVLSVLLNGVKGHFLLDPGASHSVIDEPKKEKFLLHTEPSKDKGAGLGGQAETAISFGNNLFVGDRFCLPSQTLYVMSLAHVNAALQRHGVDEIEGIIGADILTRHAAVLEYVDNTLYLKEQVIEAV
jgi:hypothetical protein